MRHHNDALEEVRACQGATGGSDSAKVMADDAFHSTVAQCVDQNDGVSDELGHGKLREVCLGKCRIIPSRRSAVTTLIECNDIVASISQGRHDLPP